MSVTPTARVMVSVNSSVTVKVPVVGIVVGVMLGCVAFVCIAAVCALSRKNLKRQPSGGNPTVLARSTARSAHLPNPHPGGEPAGGFLAPMKSAGVSPPTAPPPPPSSIQVMDMDLPWMMPAVAPDNYPPMEVYEPPRPEWAPPANPPNASNDSP